MRPRVWCVVGACGGAGGSLLAASMALVAASMDRPLVLIDADPDGVHGDLAGIRATPPAPGAVHGVLTADALRAAAYPHPRAGSLVPAGALPPGAGAIAHRVACVADGPAALVDCGSGAAGARRGDADTPWILVTTRDAAGLRAAERTRAALPDAPGAVLVMNDGCRRHDVGPRSAARLLGFADWVALARDTRDAQRVAAGEPPGGRSRLRAAAVDVLGRCGYAPRPGGGDG